MPTYDPDAALNIGGGEDAWETTDGLPSDFEGVISDVSFFYDVKYGSGNVLLASVIISRGGNEPDVEQRYSMGPGWEPIGNDKVTHERGPAQKFNKQTQYGGFVNVVGSLLPPEVRTGRDPHSADAFTGLTFFWTRERKPYEFTNKEGQLVKGESSRLMPSQFLGAKGVQLTLTAPASTNGHVVTLDLGGVSLEVPETLASSMKSLAMSETHDNFVSKVMGLPGGSQDSVVRAVTQEPFYQALRS